MINRINLTFFLLILGIHLWAIGTGLETVRFVSKVLLLVTLAVYFIAATQRSRDGERVWVLIALFFSWAGDVLLLFQGSFFFLAGLSAFLLAHTFYIIFFHRVRVREAVAGRWWLWPVVGIYYIGLMVVLDDHVADMKWPVRIYGIIISIMLVQASHMLFLRHKKADCWMMAGALLFVISDSVLAIDKFYQPFRAAGFIIMATYGVAQLFIVTGAVRYLTSSRKK